MEMCRSCFIRTKYKHTYFIWLYASDANCLLAIDAQCLNKTRTLRDRQPVKALHTAIEACDRDLKRTAPGLPLENFSKPRRRRRRQRQQTKGLMSKTVALHVRFESWYISLPSSAKQQREMTKLYVF